MGKEKATLRSQKPGTRTLKSKKINLKKINKNVKNKTFIFPTRKRFSPIREKGANPKNWSKFKFFPFWTLKGLFGTVGFLEQAPGGTLRGTTKPKSK